MFGGGLILNGGYPFGQHSAATFGGGNGAMGGGGGGGGDPSKAMTATNIGLWNDERQLELIQQYAALNNR